MKNIHNTISGWLLWVLFIALFVAVLPACSNSDPVGTDGDISIDGDTTDGDIFTDADIDTPDETDNATDGDVTDGDGTDGDTDGDVADGDNTDGDVTDGDITDGDITDGDITDGDVTDGDVTDGDVTDGDITDGDVTDGDVTDGDVSDGDVTDGDVTDGDVTDGDVTDGDITDGDSDGDVDGDSEENTQPLLFDMDLITDLSTLNCETISSSTGGFPLYETREIRYTSYEVYENQLQPIRIAAYVVIPNTTPAPGIVVAHGLGGEASDGDGLARQLGMTTLAYSGPGQGQSEGHGTDDPMRVWDTVPDPRGSWFWGHAVAGMRGLGCLQLMPEVEEDKLGFTGLSAGGLATLLSVGVDDRIVAAVPVSATADLGTATASGGWENGLLTLAGLTPVSDQFRVFTEILDPIHRLPDATANVLMVNGAQDEFFPLNSHVNTFNALPGNKHRTHVIANWDHGHFTELCIPWQYACIDNTEVAEEQINSVLELWFKHHLTSEANWSGLPGMPELAVDDSGAIITAIATIPSGNYRVTGVKIWGSVDNAYTFVGSDMQDLGGGLYGFPLSIDWHPAGTVLYAEFKLETGIIPFQRTFWLTSLPMLPNGFNPEIRPPVLGR